MSDGALISISLDSDARRRRHRLTDGWLHYDKWQPSWALRLRPGLLGLETWGSGLEPSPLGLTSNGIRSGQGTNIPNSVGTNWGRRKPAIRRAVGVCYARNDDSTVNDIDRRRAHVACLARAAHARLGRGRVPSHAPARHRSAA